MPALAAKFAVAVAATVVAWAGIEAARLRHRPTTRLALILEEVDPPKTSQAPRLATVAMENTEPGKPSSEAAKPLGVFAMARIHGRVLGGDKSTAVPQISVEDSTHSYDAEVEDDGRFQVNLPAGNYALIATSDDLVATADVAGLSENEDREVTLVLGKGAAIQGTVHGPGGAHQGFEIQLRRVGRSQSLIEAESEDNGHFMAEGLIPGRGYDITVTAPRLRTLVLHNVVAPTRGLELALEPMATLRGGFGIAAGQECPMEVARLTSADDDAESAAFNHACQFEISGLPDLPTVHLTAEGAGWHFEAEVALPHHGDPPFLCLRAPCRDSGPEPKATLAVTLVGGGARDWSYSANDGTQFRETLCRGSDVPCEIDDLRPGRSVRVRVSAHRLTCENQTIPLVPGFNTLTVRCELEREIQGVVRTVPDSQEPLPAISIRCSPGHRGQHVPGRIFQMECPEHLSAIEYQRPPGSPWLAAPVQTSGPESPGFVEIP